MTCWLDSTKPLLYLNQSWLSEGEKRRTRRTFPMARPKCLMGDFTNLYGIYKAHQTNVWWTMKVFRLHCWLIIIMVERHSSQRNFTSDTYLCHQSLNLIWKLLSNIKEANKLTHWVWEEMAVIFQTTYSNAFSWMKICKISLKFVPKGLINNIPALVQIMTWHQPARQAMAWTNAG